MAMLSVAPYRFLLVGVLAVAIFSSSAIMLSPISNQSSLAFATFPGENGKIAFTTFRDGNNEIYVMNADGTGQTRLTDNAVHDSQPDWGSTGAPPPPPPEEDTTPPVLTVPENIVVEATTAEGAQVTYTVTAQDNVDGTAMLEEDGSTVTQDDGVGGDITISCNPASGSVFSIGDTTVQCSATDAAGNVGTASFTVTVNPPPPPEPIQTVLTLNTIRDVPWGKDVTVTGKLADATNGVGIRGKTITFDGTGADNLLDVTTNTNGTLTAKGA